MKVSKNSKYQTHKKSTKLTKNPSDRTGALDALKEWTISLFFNIVAKRQKIEGEKFFFESLNSEKKLKRGTLGSLGQIIQFGTMKFCRTSKNYFRQFV